MLFDGLRKTINIKPQLSVIFQLDRFVTYKVSERKRKRAVEI